MNSQWFPHNFFSLRHLYFELNQLWFDDVSNRSKSPLLTSMSPDFISKPWFPNASAEKNCIHLISMRSTSVHEKSNERTKRFVERWICLDFSLRRLDSTIEKCQIYREMLHCERMCACVRVCVCLRDFWSEWLHAGERQESQASDIIWSGSFKEQSFGASIAKSIRKKCGEGLVQKTE